MWLAILFVYSNCDKLQLCHCSEEPDLVKNKKRTDIQEPEQNGFTFIIYTKGTAENHKARAILREKGWLSHNWTLNQRVNTDTNSVQVTWKHLFLIGISQDDRVMEEVEKENATHGDLVISDTFSFYSQQIYKLMWVFQHVSDTYTTKFLVQVDEDTVVNVDLLAEYLVRLMEEGHDYRYFYGGTNCNCCNNAFRQGQWKVATNVWPPDKYVRFCTGAGVIFSSDTVTEILSVWRKYRAPIIGYDDVMIGTLAYLSRKIKPTEIKEITLGYKKGQDKAFMLLSIKPLEVGASLLENFLRTGRYNDVSVSQHAPGA